MLHSFLEFWQHLPENLNPVIFEIGGFKLQYYGLMYLVGFAITYGMVLFRIKREDRFDVSGEQVENLMMNMIFGLLIGARLGYVLFYNLPYYLKHPLEIILPFDITDHFRFTGITGMSYHGGLIGIIIAAWLYTRRNRLNFFEMADLFVPVIPLGYTFGRLGNFINGELYGRITTAPIGMYFPSASSLGRRHPSQLYEAFFEGLFLFIILWLLRKRVQTRGAMIAFYLFGYGFVRFMIEFFRQPDAHIGFVVFFLSAGQLLCSAMMLVGVLIYLYLAFQERGMKKSPVN
ncbi:MAG: prolipoprotein diacylglyceryl transferase [Pseudomonadota bacterium]